MGRTKELLIQMQDEKWDNGIASFHCPYCRNNVDGVFDIHHEGYTCSGSEDYQVSLVCDECDNQFDGLIVIDWPDCKITLYDYPDTLVTVDTMLGNSPEHYITDHFEWLAERDPRAQDVYSIFCETMENVRQFISSITSEPSSQMLARMLLVQCITALESYLADTFISTVEKKEGVQKKVLELVEDGNKKFKLSDAIGKPSFAKDKLLNSLSNYSFHDLKKINGLFQKGLDINILPVCGERARILDEYIRLRHDCVHRNGKERGGKRHIIDKDSISKLTNILDDMVRSVENKVLNFYSVI